MFSDYERAVRLGFDDGITDAHIVGHGFPIHLAIAARALRATLNGVSGDDPGRKPVPIICLPSKLAHHRTKRQRSIITASGNYDGGALAQRLSNRECAEVHVGALHPLANLA